VSRHRKSYFKGFLYGSLIGAGLALIYSPRKGEQSQVLLREVVEDTRQRAEELVQSYKNQSVEWTRLGEDIYSRSKVLVEDVLDRIMENVRGFLQENT
jgi:gas vesicle protein